MGTSENLIKLNFLVAVKVIEIQYCDLSDEGAKKDREKRFKVTGAKGIL